MTSPKYRLGVLARIHVEAKRERRVDLENAHERRVIAQASNGSVDETVKTEVKRCYYSELIMIQSWLTVASVSRLSFREVFSK